MTKVLNQTFKDRVMAIVAKIPEGKTLTYGEVAELAGSPGAFRAVGTIMSNNWDPKIPCHRVVRADGNPGGYNRGRRNKVKILRKEGALDNEGKSNRRK
ncbi:MAG: methylated-DNA--protein-cysteine methyltransferase [Candidatus Doudnabacteria bacterium]|nr:methylated-DNA--protein-cysteine methyltransferase [Candidatus Doudnabacteria bacterium]